MPGKNPTGESEDHFEDLERNRKRLLGIGYAVLGVAESKEHEIWLAGYRAGGGVQDSQDGEASRERENSPESATTEQSSCELPAEEHDELPTKRMIKVYAEKKKRWFPLEVTFDTGTTENWLSVHAVILLGLDVKVVSDSKYRMFSGDVLESSQVVEQVRWQGDNPENSARSRFTNFRVAHEDAPFVVLFGSKLISSENIYSFNNCALILTKLEEKEESKKLKEANKKKVDEQAQALAKERKSSSAAGSARAGNSKSGKEPRSTRK